MGAFRSIQEEQEAINLNISVEDILADYRLACESRQASIIGRKEVFMGKAKFGVFGDGKEIAQIAMARAFQKGDYRSGYYRDMTFMFALGVATMQEFFAQLYAHADVNAEPSSAGRMMNSHFGTRMIDENGEFVDQTQEYNSSSDISPTAGQMPRLLGLAFASRLYRQNPELKNLTQFSVNGNEVAFGTCGDAATSEGMFLETINAMGVLQVPVVLSIWDDDYGISVPKEYHTTHCSISEALKGFRRTGPGDDPRYAGIEIFCVKGWDYEGLIQTYADAAKLAREEHVPVLIHVEEMTQPQGHTTSGSHERYKSNERLAWEKEYDCNRKMREWILENNIATEAELESIEKEAQEAAKKAKNDAWKAYSNEIKQDQQQVLQIIERAAAQSNQGEKMLEVHKALKEEYYPGRLDVVKAAKKTLRLMLKEENPERQNLIRWLEESDENNYDRYNTWLYSETPYSALNVQEVKPEYNEDAPWMYGYEILQNCFDKMLARDPRVFAMGEDVGKIGDVNQGFAGLQEKHGELRVMDTGIRETTIIGQGIGAAMRGLRPIAEIQYLDYIYYAMATLTDDLACLRYRTKGGQTAPMILRTRGHRLEGVWHSGSPIGMILGSLRGVYLLVPRNMVQAAGFYNTMLQSDDPAVIIETLNAYRLKEKLPANLGEFTVPLGVPEILREGTDVTIVTYGAMCRIVLEAAEQLAEVGISCEVIDAQSLLPFDIHHSILESVKKTNRAVFADEDVPGGGSAYMMQKVVEEQGAYQYLDNQPITISGKDHRPAYSSDGDYFSKPNPETVFDTVYEMMSDFDPEQYPPLYS